MGPSCWSVSSKGKRPRPFWQCPNCNLEANFQDRPFCRGCGEKRPKAPQWIIDEFGQPGKGQGKGSGKQNGFQRGKGTAKEVVQQKEIDALREKLRRSQSLDRQGHLGKGNKGGL